MWHYWSYYKNIPPLKTLKLTHLLVPSLTCFSCGLAHTITSWLCPHHLPLKHVSGFNSFWNLKILHQSPLFVPFLVMVLDSGFCTNTHGFGYVYIFPCSTFLFVIPPLLRISSDFFLHYKISTPVNFKGIKCLEYLSLLSAQRFMYSYIT